MYVLQSKVPSPRQLFLAHPSKTHRNGLYVCIDERGEQELTLDSELAATYAALILADEGIEITVSTHARNDAFVS